MSTEKSLECDNTHGGGELIVLKSTSVKKACQNCIRAQIFGSSATLCGICPNPHKSIELQFSKNYLTTKDPSLVRIQKIQKFRKIYSPDPDSGSGIPEI